MTATETNLTPFQQEQTGDKMLQAFGEAPALSSDASMMMHPATFEHMQRVCKMYAQSSVVPQQFQGNLPNCMIAFELANRMNVNVFMLMQSMYVVQGKPGLEGKLAIALVNERGPFRGTIQYTFERDDKGSPVACTAYAIHKQSGERCEVRIDWHTVEKEGWLNKSGSKWKTMPEQMFRYRTASWLARTYCPEVLMGMHTTDELEDTYGNTRFVDSSSPARPSLADRIERDEPQPQAEQQTSTNASEAPAEEQQPTDRGTADAEPAAEARTPQTSAGDGAGGPERWELLVEQLAVKAEREHDAAYARLESWSQKWHKIGFDQCSDKQLEQAEQLIASGGIKIE